MVVVEIKQSLKRLGNLVALTNEAALNGKILNYLLENELIGDDIDDCGLTIDKIYERSGVELDHNEIIKMVGTHSDTIENIIGNLLVWNQLGDCPECGCEVEIEEDSQDVYTWENKKCTNSECDFSDNNEPDWDSMPGGHDYY